MRDSDRDFKAKLITRRGAGIGAVVSPAGEDENEIAGPGQAERALSDTRRTVRG
jgi:hypothetical protein